VLETAADFDFVTLKCLLNCHWLWSMVRVMMKCTAHVIFVFVGVLV